MKVSVIIPVFNEVTTAQKLLDLVWAQPLPGGLDRELVIVESNSSDGSRDVVREFAERHPEAVKLVLQEHAKGKGDAVRRGFEAATGDILLIQDSDLEYDVRDYPRVLQPILDRATDFVLGSRYLGTGHWRIRKFERSPAKALFLNLGGVFFHALFNTVYQEKLTDPTTMFKVFTRDCLDDFELCSSRFDFDYELLAKLLRTGRRPIEVPVSYVSRDFEAGKKIRIVRDPLTWIRAILWFRFSRL